VAACAVRMPECRFALGGAPHLPHRHLFAPIHRRVGPENHRVPRVREGPSPTRPRGRGTRGSSRVTRPAPARPRPWECGRKVGPACRGRAMDGRGARARVAFSVFVSWARMTCRPPPGSVYFILFLEALVIFAFNKYLNVGGTYTRCTNAQVVQSNLPCVDAQIYMDE
jgi:hypothetical protein